MVDFSIRNLLKRKDKKEILIVLLFAFFWNLFAYNFPRLFTGSWHHYDMTMPVDELFPFMPWTVSIYFGCYLFWYANYYIVSLHDKQHRDQFFCADMIAKLICMIIFVAIPTTNVRPKIVDNDLWSFLMRFLHIVDDPDNLFPSIHCLVSWLCWIGIRKRKDVSLLYRWFSLALALAICIVTLTTRQHVIVDVISGVALAEICYFLAGIPKIRVIYTCLIEFLVRLFTLPKNKNK